MAGRLAKEWLAWPGPEQATFLPAAGRKNRPRAQKSLAESSLHATVADALDWLLLPPAVYTTFPAGWGELTPAMAGRLKRCGLKAGMPDILVFHNSRCLGIELKVHGRSQTAVQREMTARLVGAGIYVYVARSLRDVMEILRTEAVPVKNTGGTL